MADDTPTRQATVEENIENVENKYGPDSYWRVVTQCVKDISVSLAMLVDAGSGS